MEPDGVRRHVGDCGESNDRETVLLQRHAAEDVAPVLIRHGPGVVEAPDLLRVAPNEPLAWLAPRRQGHPRPDEPHVGSRRGRAVGLCDATLERPARAEPDRARPYR